MTFKKGHKLSIGNKGGGRHSTKCEFTREEMVIKAIGKWAKAVRDFDTITDKQADRIQKLIMPIVSKAMPTEIKGGISVFSQSKLLEEINDKSGTKDKT